jgi:parallel beta-helix repeat protein
MALPRSIIATLSQGVITLMPISFRGAILIVSLIAIGGCWRVACATDYHVNSATGSDDNPGTRAQPWKNIARVNAQQLRAGDRILFARNTSYVGALKIPASGTETAPIVVGTYGEGAAPRLMNPRFADEYGRIVSVLGRHVVVEGLYLHDTPTPPPDNPPRVWSDSPQHRLVTDMAAIFVDKEASQVTIRNNEFSNAGIGIRVRGSRSLVTHNYLHDASRITEQWGAIAIAIVGPDNEVSYNRIENYGFYGGSFADDGAAVELDGEDKAFDAHGIHIHHNVSRNTKGGFLEIAANARDVTVDHNVSDDIEKFVGTNGIRNLRILNNTVVRTRLPDITSKDPWTFRTLFWAICWNGCEGDRDRDVVIAGNLFYLDRYHRIYMSPDNPHGFMSATHVDNLYGSPGGDAAAMLGQPLGAGEVIAQPRFRDAVNGDFSLHGARRKAGATYFGAYPPGERPWSAGLVR